MAEVASLLLAVDSSQVKTADKDLSALATTATRVANEVDKLPVANNNVAKSVRSMADSVTKATNSFGLAGHQVKNLTAQVVDFGVQVSSGGGFLFPIIQQGPQAVDALGGISGAINVAGQALTRFGAIVGPVAAGVTAVFASIGADSAAREMERLADRFKILQNRFGSGLSGDEIQRQLNGVMSAAQRTGVSINSLANAQRDFVEATMRGGSLTKNGVFGIDVGTMEQSTEAVELLARGLEAAGVSAGDAGPLVESFFASIRRDGQLSAKVLDEIMTVAPKFGKPLIDALGGASSLFYRLSQGAKIGGKDAVNAIIGIQRQIEQLEKQHIPSVGQAFSKVGGQADAAFKKIGLAIGGEGVSFADLMAKAVLKIGDGFVYIGEHADSFVASVNSVLAPFKAVAQEVVGIADGIGKAARVAFDSLLGWADSLIAKTRQWLGISGIPGFITSSINAVSRLIEKLEEAARKSQQMTPDEKRRQLDGGYSGGLGGEPSFGPLVPDPGNRGEASSMAATAIAGPLQQGFRDLIKKNEEQVAAAKQGANAAQQTTAAAERGFTGLTGTVTNGIGVWSSGNDAVQSGVDQNTASTRSGLDRVRDAVSGLGSIIGRLGSGGGGGGGRPPSSGDGYHTGSTGGFVYDGYGEARDKDGDGFALTESLAGVRGTHQISPSGFGLVGPRGYGSGGGGLFDLGGLGYRENFGGGGTATWGMGGSMLGGGGGFLGRGAAFDLTAANEDEPDSRNDLVSALSALMPDMGAVTADNPATPDPYKMRNPDYFYNNTTGQVTKAKTDADVLRSLPKDIAKEIADALVKAGIVGEKIGEAIVQADRRPTAAPTPQDGWLPNRGPIRGNYGPGIYNRTAMR